MEIEVVENLEWKSSDTCLVQQKLRKGQKWDVP